MARNSRTVMPEQLALPVKLPDHARLESYLPGPNQEAVSHVQHIATDGLRSESLWLWGGPSTGKSHLLQAASAEAGGLGQRIVYLPLQSLPLSASDALAGLVEQADLVCLDDLQAVAGRAEWELAVFALWNGLQDFGGRLILASREPPAALPWQLADLRSRLGSAVVYRLHALDEAQLLAALVLRARRRGLQLPEETARWLLRRAPRDATTLFSLLDRLDAEALAAQRPLTVPFVRGALEGILREGALAGDGLAVPVQSNTDP